jgi:hypothetical protein
MGCATALRETVMPIGVCPYCQRRFVIEDERSFQRTCPRCLRPMQIPTEETMSSSDPPSQQPPDTPSRADDEGPCLNGTPLAAGELGQRLMRTLAEAAYQRACSRGQRRTARGRRGEEESPADEMPTVAPPFPDPDDGEPLNNPIRQSAWLQQRAGALVERAQGACVKAKIVTGQARVARENRQASTGELALLPPLDYRLPPLNSCLPGPPGGSAAADRPAAGSATSTILYVWGYDPPQSMLCCDHCEISEAARQFAAESGWDQNQPGAWAKAITLPWGLTKALRIAEPILREDSGVVGWGCGSSVGVDPPMGCAGHPTGISCRRCQRAAFGLLGGRGMNEARRA